MDATVRGPMSQFLNIKIGWYNLAYVFAFIGTVRIYVCYDHLRLEFSEM